MDLTVLKTQVSCAVVIHVYVCSVITMCTCNVELHRQLCCRYTCIRVQCNNNVHLQCVAASSVVL